MLALGGTNSETNITATTMSISGYLGSAQVTVATDTKCELFC